ncbi:MAG: DUF1667 domain-containing protein [Oscillospiraceae bacterium]|nr:DUF1667 domain-containing protein [Oscillospiraceae bacterium]
MTRELTCIICPKGCRLCVEGGDNRLTVRGNACPRGEQYAIAECTNPLRTVTAVLRVSNRCDTMVCVKTESPVPKAAMFAVMERLHQTTVTAPVSIGDIVMDDLFGSRIVVTKGAI